MFILTYDLINANFEDYEKIKNGIKSNYPFASKLTESCWFIPNASDTVSILSTIKKFVKNTDRLVVSELKSFPLGSNMIEDPSPLKKLVRKPLGTL
jgi:hypothetical protein